MAFDIASVLKNVSAPDTGAEQIEYLPIDSLLPDPNNFYLLDGLEELAANIELIGLQQPLRVRPAEDKGFYTIVSGHRRKAACMMIRDGGSDMFDRGVPCIVERGEASAALRELRLIYANSATRVMSASELSKQAERVEILLYTLQGEGMEFPGRMRDHVAEACKVSKTKLARLHAIRKNLAPDLLEAYFDTGKLNESTAYAISRKDPDLQRWIIDQYKATHRDDPGVPEWWANNFSEDAEAMDAMVCRQTAGGGSCIHKREHVEKMWRHGYRGYDGCIRGHEAKCCFNCESLASCSISCTRCDPKKKKLKADIAAQRKSERETKAADEANRQEQQELDVMAAALYWKRLAEALKGAGIDFWKLQDTLAKNNKIHGSDTKRVLCTYLLSNSDIEALLKGEPAKNDGLEIPTPFSWKGDVRSARMLNDMADLLGVSIDYLMLHDTPAVSGSDTEKAEEIPILSAAWQIGEPVDDGRYFCRVLIGEDERPHEQRMEWRAGGWRVFGDPADKYQMQVVAWWPLPPEVM